MTNETALWEAIADVRATLALHDIILQVFVATAALTERDPRGALGEMSAKIERIARASTSTTLTPEQLQGTVDDIIAHSRTFFRQTADRL